MWRERKHAGVAGPLVAGIALLLFGGVAQAADENLIADQAFEVTQPEPVEVIQPEFIEIIEPEALIVSEPPSLEVSEPNSLESGRFPKGEYKPAERENSAYNRCAKLKGFSDRQKCALEALGLAQE